MKHAIRLLSHVLTIALLLSCEEKRPGIGLALGGGGAKCASEVGALIAIDEANVPIDYIAGSSMGALVGGLYAAGYSGEEIKEMWLTEEWLKLFDRHAIGFIHGESGSELERNIFGVIDGYEFEERLRQVLREKGCETFQDLRIPFQCTATEVVDDEYLREYVFQSGDVATAIRASLSFPAPIAGFPPVLYDGKQFIDGGTLNNLPVDVVKDMGAKYVIAIDLEMKQRHTIAPIMLNGLKLLTHGNGIASRIGAATNSAWLAHWDIRASDMRHKRNWEMADVKIKNSRLRNYDILCFDRADIEQMIRDGKQAMKDQIYKVSDLLQEQAQEQ